MLDELSSILQAQGHTSEVLALRQRALAIDEREYGPDHPDVGTDLGNLAIVHAIRGSTQEALNLMTGACHIHDRLIWRVLSLSSENQRLIYVQAFQKPFDIFLSLISQYHPKSPTAVREGLDLVLRRKVIGAEAAAAQRDAVLGGKYPTLEPKLWELAKLRTQIAQKTLAGSGSEGLAAHQQLLAQWSVQKEKLEAELARQIPEMNLERKLQAADRQAVAQVLPERTVLVEFIRFKVFDFKAVRARGESQWKPARYLAFVLPAGEPNNVQMVDLGEAEPIDQMIATFRSAITGEVESRGKRDLGVLPGEPVSEPSISDGIALCAALFDPLLPAIGNRKRLLLAPDGDLTRLPFEVLPTDDGRHLIDDYQISYLSTGRDVLRFGAASSGQPTEPLIAADPDFDLSGRHQVQLENDVVGAAMRGRVSRDLDRSHLHFDRLPGTRVEGERIAGIFNVQPWLADQALEACLKACRSPRIVHLATHGFFLADQPRAPNKERRDLSAMGWQAGGGWGRMSGPGMENPLLRSGLALAGANTFLEHGNLPAEAEDGILTAEDVSGLDLLATELVVLSACETGLSEVRTGEGVFGLRRAFVLAGGEDLGNEFVEGTG